MKKYLKLLLIFIPLCFAIIVYGQKKDNERIDSLLRALASYHKEDTNKVNLLDAITDAFSADFPDESIIYDKEEIFLSAKLHWPKGIADGYRHLGDDYGTEKNYDQAKEVFFNSLIIYDTLKDEENSGITLIKIGLVYRAQKKYDSGLVVTSMALNIFEHIGDSAYLAVAYGNISILYMCKNDFVRSLESSFKCLKIAESINNVRLISETYGLIGMAYLSLAKDTTVDGYKTGKKQNLLKATEYLQKGIAGCAIITEGDDNPISDALEYCKRLSETYALSGNYQKAYETALAAITFDDSIQSGESRRENEIREQVFRVNKKELQKDALEIKLKRNQQVLFILAIILLLIVIVLVVWNFTAQTRRHDLTRMLMEYKIRNDIAADLHDHIGSSLSSIMLMSNIAKQQPVHAPDYLTQISNTSDKIIDNMNDIVWAVNPDNDRMEQILVRMQDFAAMLLEKKNITIQFEVSGNMDSVKLNMEERKNFYLVFKEIIHNVFKHSGCSNVTIWLGLQNDSHGVIMKVHDNGKGFDTAQKYTGNGLHNLQKRVTEIKGEIEIVSAPGEGTTIQVQFIPTQKGG